MPEIWPCNKHKIKPVTHDGSTQDAIIETTTASESEAVILLDE